MYIDILAAADGSSVSCDFQSGDCGYKDSSEDGYTWRYRRMHEGK